MKGGQRLVPQGEVTEARRARCGRSSLAVVEFGFCSKPNGKLEDLKIETDNMIYSFKLRGGRRKGNFLMMMVI